MNTGNALGFQTADLMLWEILKTNSRVNRSNPTVAESLMWQMLRNNSTGYKIRRQHAIDGYITDFVCLGKGLVIEIDGGYHQFTKEQDELRTLVLNAKGFHVIRFTNEEVIRESEKVLQAIKTALGLQPDRKV
jgi:methylmalonyl-CoA mutase